MPDDLKQLVKKLLVISSRFTRLLEISVSGWDCLGGVIGWCAGMIDCVSLQELEPTDSSLTHTTEDVSRLYSSQLSYTHRQLKLTPEPTGKSLFFQHKCSVMCRLPPFHLPLFPLIFLLLLFPQNPQVLLRCCNYVYYKRCRRTPRMYLFDFIGQHSKESFQDLKGYQ